MERGVLTLAVKKPVYGNMAYNLAVSIKLPNPDVKVQLVCDDEAISELSEEQKEIFDILTPVEGKYADMNPGELKVNMYDLSAFFGGTLFIDADSIMFPTSDINRLLGTLSGYGYQPFYRNSFDKDTSSKKLMFGFSMDDCKDDMFREVLYFGGKSICEANSHFMFFSRTPRIENFFYKVKEVYKGLSEGNVLQGKVSEWQGQIPDEAAFSIATYITGTYPDIPGGWQPIHDVWSEVGSFNHVTGAVGMIGKYGLTMQGDTDPNREQFYDYVCMLLKIKYHIKDLFKWEEK